MPAPIVLSTLTPETKKVVNPPEGQPVIATKAEFRDGSRASFNEAHTIFQENFNNQPDYTSTLNSLAAEQTEALGHTIPTNWDAVYQGTSWSPETGFLSNKATIEILSSNSGRGGSGKCFLGTRESNADATSGNFQSDGQLIKAPIQAANTEGTSELYVEFWIRFDANWWHRGSANGVYTGGWTSKIFRAASFNIGGSIANGGLGDLGPMFYWDYVANDFGLRNFLSFRGGPPANLATPNNYNDSTVTTFERQYNYNALDIAGQEVGGANPQLPDLVNGGLLSETDRLVTHEMLFGDASRWTKMGFYLKMNSAPGVADGVFSQYISDHRIMHFSAIPWVPANDQNLMVKWNHFSLGGNDFFAPFAPDQLFEDYYYIDDVVAMDSLPEALI